MTEECIEGASSMSPPQNRRTTLRRRKHDETERDRKESSVRSSKKARRRSGNQELRKFLPTLSFDHRRGDHRGSDPAVHADRDVGSRYSAVETSNEEIAWLVDRLTGNVYKCHAEVRGKATCEADVATGSIPQPKR
jgi:hypothetical protein